MGHKYDLSEVKDLFDAGWRLSYGTTQEESWQSIAKTLAGMGMMLLEGEIEDRKEHPSEWGVKWYVKVPNKNPFECESEGEALSLAAKACETHDFGDVEVFCREIQLFAPEVIPNRDWGKNEL